MAVDGILKKINFLENKITDLESTFQIEMDKVIIKFQELEGKFARAEIRANKANIDKKYRESIESARLKNKKAGVPGRIRVGRVAGVYEKGRKYPITFGYKNISVVSLNKSNLGCKLSPFTLRDESGRLHENIWQFSKIYEIIPSQKQKSGWYWNMERHVDSDNVDDLSNLRSDHTHETVSINKYILEEYWKWRQSGMEFNEPVRYPVGFNKRHACLGCVWPFDDKYEEIDNPDYPMKILGYVDARKTVYAKLYIDMAKKTEEFAKIQNLLNDGYNLQILDVDCAQPNCGLKMKQGTYGEDGVGSLEINEKNVKFLLNNPNVPFGHSYALACALLGKEDWILRDKV